MLPSLLTILTQLLKNLNEQIKEPYSQITIPCLKTPTQIQIQFEIKSGITDLRKAIANDQLYLPANILPKSNRNLQFMHSP